MPFTDSDVKGLLPQTKKYRVAAGDSLFVEVYPSGGRYFIWRHRFPPGREGKLRDYQIGPYGKGPGKWTLKQAREERDRLEVLRRQGDDPRAEKAGQRKQIQRMGAVSFKKAAEEWFLNVSNGNGNKKLAPSTLKDYSNKLRNQIMPIFGDRLITSITRSECLDFKKSIEARGALNQSDKVFLLLRQVFSYAIDREWMPNSNPARKSIHASSGHVTKHHPSLAWNDFPAFLEDLSTNKGKGETVTLAGAKVLLLTFMRVGAVIPGMWEEIDWKQKMWTIPAERMKGRNMTRQEHMIPLSQPLIDLLETLKPLTSHSPYIFESLRGKTTEHICQSAPNNMIKRMGYQGKVVAHGFRAMAVTYGQDILKFPFHVIDLQMGHKPQGKVRQAYDKALYMNERIEFMNKWGDLLVEKGLIV